MKNLKGISVSEGIGIGKAFIILQDESEQIPHYNIKEEEKEKGWQRFERAAQKTKEYLESSRDESNETQLAIFDMYILMLTDAQFLSELKTAYEAQGVNIEAVLHCQTKEYSDKLRSANDEYLKERAEDIDDVFGRVLDILLGKISFHGSEVPDGAVIVAKALKPSDALLLSKAKPSALVLEEGGIGSHLAILARTYEIPAVFAVKNIVSHIHNNVPVIVDVENAQVIVDPDTETQSVYAQKILEFATKKQTLKKYRTKPALTKDGEEFTLLANIGSADEAQLALDEGAQGIGLFRTEFMFMECGTFLGEEEQFKEYKKVLHLMGEKPVIIRTLDAGGDKLIPSDDNSLETGLNPLLGWRAIRFCLSRLDIFKLQLRALYRASVFGNLKIMLPLITTYDELVQTLAIIEEVKKELELEQKAFKADVPVGVMIETASAAIIADWLAKKSDFFSIGTNDLTQYTLAVDREKIEVAHLFDECNPAVLRLIKNTVQEAKKEGILVSVCGEFASKPEGVILLAGLGVRTLSMSASCLCGIKHLLADLTIDQMETIAQKVYALSPEENAKKVIRDELERREDG